MWIQNCLCRTDGITDAAQAELPARLFSVTTEGPAKTQEAPTACGLRQHCNQTTAPRFLLIGFHEFSPHLPFFTLILWEEMEYLFKVQKNHIIPPPGVF